MNRSRKFYSQGGSPTSFEVDLARNANARNANEFLAMDSSRRLLKKYRSVRQVSTSNASQKFVLPEGPALATRPMPMSPIVYRQPYRVSPGLRIFGNSSVT